MFEYLTIDVGYTQNERLQELGKEGWELVSVVNTKTIHIENGYSQRDRALELLAFFKRQIR